MPAASSSRPGGRHDQPTPATARAPARFRFAGWALAAAGVAVVVVAVVALATRGGGADTSTTPATAAVVPSTVASRSTSAPSTMPPTVTNTAGRTTTTARPTTTSPPRRPTVTAPAPPTTTTATATTTTLPLSPLNTLIGEAGSALPSPLADVTAPVLISVDGIDVDEAPVRSVGVTPDGQLEIPGATEVGWYRLGSSPGRPGATVLAAHVSWRGANGVFLRLQDVQLGAAVTLVLDDLTTRRYVVVERAQYGKLELPAERVWTRAGPETLVLITCGGEFNPEIRRYADNVVAYAVPVA